MKRTGVNLVVFVGLCLGVGGLSSDENRGGATRGKVVSYLATLSTADHGRPLGSEWRVFDPATGADQLFLLLPQKPENIFWDADFQRVYYRVDSKIYRAAWTAGSQPEEVVAVPSELAGMNSRIEAMMMEEKTGAWRLKTWDHAESQEYASVWEYSPRNRHWRLLERIPTECECGGCPCTDVVNHLVQHKSAVALADLLESMRVEHHLLRTEQLGSDWREGIHEFSSESVAGRRLRVEVQMGDSLHALEPLFYVNEETGEERVLSGGNNSCHPAGHIAFQEDGYWLLVGADYTGGCGLLVDMRNGTLWHSFPATSLSAVWVAPLRR